MAAGAIAAIIIGAASAWYSADQSRRQAHEAEDAAKERAQQAAEQAERLAKIQATKDKTVAEASEALGKLDLGEQEAKRKKRARGKALFKIAREESQAADTGRLQIGATTPSTRQQGVQL